MIATGVSLIVMLIVVVVLVTLFSWAAKLLREEWRDEP